jgi:hypothetical protein
MKKYGKILGALMVSASVMFSGCGDNADTSEVQSKTVNDHEEHNNGSTALDLEHDAKTLLFYSASTNTQLAYDVSKASLTDLNNNSDEDLLNYKLTDSQKGKLFVWLDDKGDANVSNDEEKIVMFKENYSFLQNGNATFEDFFYIGHFHEEIENGIEHHHLAAHDNKEFDLSNVPAEDLATNAKHLAMIRLNKYLANTELVENSISAKLSTLSTPTTLCYAKTVTNDLSTRHYVMGVNGQLYVYDNNFAFVDQVTISESCEKNKAGISGVSHHDEYGVVVFEAGSQKLYLVDAHDGGVYHVHTSYEANKVVGSSSVNSMVSIAPLEEHEEH